MTELEILQQRFVEMAEQFPGLMHILTIWPKDGKEPKLYSKYMPTEDNLLSIWSDGLIREYIPDKNMKHWLIKPRHASWDIDDTRENFQNLAQNAGRVLCEKGFLSQLELSKCISGLSQCALINNKPAELWVLLVHGLGNTKRFVSESRDIKISIGHDFKDKRFEKEQIRTYYEVQKDFFLNSSLVISRLLEKNPKSLLSERQLEVWDLLKGKCLSAKELGKSLDLSAENIRKHIQAIRKKYGQEVIENTGSRGYWRPDDPPSNGVNKT